MLKCIFPFRTILDKGISTKKYFQRVSKLEIEVNENKVHENRFKDLSSSLLHKFKHGNKRTLTLVPLFIFFLLEQARLGFNFGCNLMHSKSRLKSETASVTYIDRVSHFYP